MGWLLCLGGAGGWDLLGAKGKGEEGRVPVGMQQSGHQHSAECFFFK